MRLRLPAITVAATALLLAAAAGADAHAPTVGFAYAPQAPRTGEPIGLVASGTVEAKNGPLRFAWDLDADGAFDDADGSTATADLRRGSRTIRVRATDKN